MISFRILVFALAAVSVQVKGAGINLPSLPSFGLSNQAQASSFGGWDITIPGMASSSLSVKSTPASKGIGGSLTIEDNGIEIPIQLGPAGGFQADLVEPILPIITDIIKLAQKAVGNLGGILSAVLNQSTNVISMIVNNIAGFLDAVGKPIQTLLNGAGSIINKLVNEGFITTGKALEIITSVIQSALKNTLNHFADVVNLVQYAINQKLILEEEGLVVLAAAANQSVHLISNGINWSLEGFLNATAQAKLINDNVANTLTSLLRGNSASAADNSFFEASPESKVERDMQIDVTVLEG